MFKSIYIKNKSNTTSNITSRRSFMLCLSESNSRNFVKRNDINTANYIMLTADDDSILLMFLDEIHVSTAIFNELMSRLTVSGCATATVKSFKWCAEASEQNASTIKKSVWFDVSLLGQILLKFSINRNFEFMLHALWHHSGVV